jgi:hypothetical protein
MECDITHMECDITHMECDITHMECDITHVECDSPLLPLAPAGEAAAALANMCYGSAKNQTALVEAGGVEALVGVLKGDPRAPPAQKAAAALANVSGQHTYDAMCVRGGVDALLEVLYHYYRDEYC